jgi:hypothetical protein
MSAHASRFARLPWTGVGVTAILTGATAIAAAMIWLGAGSSAQDPAPALGNLVAAHGVPERASAGIRTRPKCPGCGVIVSMREVEPQSEASGQAGRDAVLASNTGEVQVTPVRGHEITVRMADGSSRVINHASPANWRPGERVVVIDGAGPSSR